MKRRELKKAVVLIKLLPLLGLGVSAVALADNAAPVASTPSAPPARRTTSFDGLSLAQLKATFPYFAVHTVGRDPNQEVVMSGTVFDDCNKFFTISNSQSNAGDAVLNQPSRLGFKVSDPTGQGRACMKNHANDVCSAAIPCDHLSADPNAHMKLNGSVPDADIGIITNDPNAVDTPNGQVDPQGLAFDEIATHHSSASLKAQHDAQKKAANDALVVQANKELQVCNKNQDELDVASNALSTICSVPGVSPKDCDKAHKTYDADVKRAAATELKAFATEAGKVKLTDDDAISDLSDRLTEYAGNHDGSSDQIAKIYADLTNRLVSAKNAGDDQFAQARLLVDAASNLPDLSDSVSARLAQYPMQIDMLQLQKKAQSGNVDQSTFMPAYQNLMKEAYNNVQSNCQMSAMSQSGIPAGCSNAIQAMNSAQKIPQQYAQAVQQQYSFQQSVNQAIFGAQAQMSSPMMGNSNPYMTAPMVGAGMSPQLVGGTPISSPTWR